MDGNCQSHLLEVPDDRAALPLGHLAIHDTVVKILGELPRGPLLDVPAGEGALAERLLKLGFDAHCCDLYPEIFRARGIEIKRGDMKGVLPYQDKEFQVITCVEGLEHIDNPAQAIKEFERLLKPNGYLIISVPNILNIEERIKWLLHGYTSHFKPLSREFIDKSRRDFGEMEEIALHVHPIAYSELRYYLEKYGFRIVNIFRDKPKSQLWLYWPLVALIRLIGKLAPERKRQERWTDALNSDEVLMGGNTLIIHAVKSGP